MPHSTLSIKELKVRPKKKDGIGSLENVGGVPLHIHVPLFINHLVNKTILDNKHKRYFQVEKVLRHGRAITVIAESGYYGDPGNTYDVTNGKVTHKRTENEASTSMVRVTLVVPPGAPKAFAVIESRPGIPNGNMFIDSFLRELRGRYETLYFPWATVYEQDAWSAGGQLKEIEIVRENQPLNLSSGIDSNRDNETFLGNLGYTAVPPKGVKFWPKRVWEGLRDGSIDAAVFLKLRGEEEAQDPDENVHVTVERDGRQKTFELGSDGKPSIREVLTTGGEELLDDEEFLTKVVESVSGLYEDMDMSWDDQWLDLDWPDKWMNLKW